MDLDNSVRYSTHFQNRILKGFSGIAAIDQHELLMGKSQLIAEKIHSVEPKDQAKTSEAQMEGQVLEDMNYLE